MRAECTAGVRRRRSHGNVPCMRVFLKADRLVLRRFTEADVDNLFELNSDPEVMRFLNGGELTPRDEVRTRIIPTFLGYYERFEGFGFWAAAEIATGQFLGWFHFRPPLRDADSPAGWDEDGVAELGYRLRRSAWGKGYATEGSRALIDKGFTEFDVRRVVAETVAGNWGSRRVLEKSGLVQVHTSTSADSDAAQSAEQDRVVFELTRAGWEARAR
jgi:RimJ/RimL family protein N-acetyltransferase